MITLPVRSRVSGALAASLLVLSFLPATVGAHAELDVVTPADGATVEGSPVEVAGTYTETLEAGGSSLQLRDAAGTVIATGGVDPADDHRLVITDMPPLATGEYEVFSTTLSAEDGEIDRATWTFTVTAAPTPSPTAVPNPTPTTEPSSAPSAEPTAAPSATAAPTPTGHEIPTGASDSDAILPIIAGLAIVLIAGVILLGRRGRTGGAE